MNKTVLLGLDGATFSVISENRDRLSNISSLIDSGCAMKLESTDPPFTSVAWPAFVTGQNPGKYGIFDFMNRRPETMEFYINDTRKKQFNFFWDYMSEDIGLASIPLIPYNDNGSFFIQGSLARVNENLITNPPSLKNQLPPKYDYHFRWREDNSDIIESLIDRVGHREEVFCQLASHYDIPMYFFMFQALDHAQHHFWAHMDQDHPAHEPSEFSNAIPRLYERVDQAVGKILDEFDTRPNVVIASDHGFTRAEIDVDLDNFLESHQYMVPTGGLEKSTESALMSAKDYIFTSSLYDLIPEKLMSIFRDILSQRKSHQPNIDWESTTVYRFGSSQNLYVNLSGREPNGIVRQSEYADLIDEVTDALHALEEQTTHDLFDSIRGKHDVYWGPYAEEAPDIVLRQKEGVRLWGNIEESECVEPVTQAMPNSGMHAQDGVLIVNGPDFQRNGFSCESAHITDVAPTVLHLFGYDAPQEIDGQKITKVLANPDSSGIEAVRSERTRIRNRILSMKQLDNI